MSAIPAAGLDRQSLRYQRVHGTRTVAIHPRERRRVRATCESGGRFEVDAKFNHASFQH